MHLGRHHPRIGVMAAAAALAVLPVVVAGSSAGAAPVAATAATAFPGAAPAVDGPADPAAAKAQIEKNWTAFFDSKVAVAKKAELLQHGEFLVPLLGGFARDTDTAVSSAEVSDVVFTSPTAARVTYDLLVGGFPVLSGSEGTAVLEDGVWKVSTKTLCALIELSGNAVPIC